MELIESKVFSPFGDDIYRSVWSFDEDMDCADLIELADKVLAVVGRDAKITDISCIGDDGMDSHVPGNYWEFDSADAFVKEKSNMIDAFKDEDALSIDVSFKVDDGSGWLRIATERNSGEMMLSGSEKATDALKPDIENEFADR